MARASAGVLLYRLRGETEVLLVHPGGPYWAGRHEGAWSIPKGEYDPGVEDAEAAARREFLEETGSVPPDVGVIDLGEVTQKAGKAVRAFAIEGDLDADAIVSNTFEMEWPPRSGRIETFPEVDRAAWCGMQEAARLINPAQVELLDRLNRALAGG